MHELCRNVIFLADENGSIAPVVVVFLGQPEMIASMCGGWRLRVDDPDVISGCSGRKMSGFKSSHIEHITGTSLDTRWGVEDSSFGNRNWYSY